MSNLQNNTTLLRQLLSQAQALPDAGITPIGSVEITENGTHDVTEYAEAVVNVPVPTFETDSKTVNPTEQQQVVTSDKDGLSSVTVNPISSTYVGSGITRNPTPTANGATVTIPSGYYSSQTTKSVASGALGAVSASKGTVSNNSITVTPKIEGGTAGYISETSKIGDGVTVSASELVSGNKGFTATETAQSNIDITNFKTASVAAISSTYVGSGITKRSSTDLSASGATVTVPAGYYSAQATKSVTTGSAGTPSASKGTVSNHQMSVTPTVTNTTGYITGGTKTGTAVTVSASELVSGSETKTENGTYDVTNLAQLIVNVASGGGASLPSGISAFDFGNVVVNSAFTTTRQTFQHKLGVTPDLMIVYAPSNIATTYSMLAAIRGNVFGWRSSAYNNHLAYHGNSTTSVTWTNSNSTTYGISSMTATSFQLASSSSSYYWRAGTYKYMAFKFS